MQLVAHHIVESAMIEHLVESLGAIPAVKLLLTLGGLDIVSGVIVAASKRTLNSSTSFRGMCKKAMMLLMVGVGLALEPHANGVPIATLIALGYVKGEALSICENAAALGLPLPAVLADLLEKIQQNKAAKLKQKTKKLDA